MENLLWIAAAVVGLFVVFWIVRKAFKLALLAALVVAGLLIWYFFVRG